MKPRPEKVRKHVFMSERNAKWLEAQQKRTRRSLGDLLDHIIEVYRSSTKKPGG